MPSQDKKIFSLEELQEIFPGKWEHLSGLQKWYLASFSGDKVLAQISYSYRNNDWVLYDSEFQVPIDCSNFKKIVAFYKKHFKFQNFK